MSLERAKRWLKIWSGVQKKRPKPPAFVTAHLGGAEANRVITMSDDRQNVVDMAGTRVDDDHLLSMYVDNELDAERTIALVSRLRSEPALRARLEVMEANDQRVRTLFAESDNHVPEHLVPMVAAKNVSVLGMTRRSQRWASVAVAASFATAVALIIDLNQTDVFNPMSMDPQLASALEQSS